MLSFMFLSFNQYLIWHFHIIKLGCTDIKIKKILVLLFLFLFYLERLNLYLKTLWLRVNSFFLRMKHVIYVSVCFAKNLFNARSWYKTKSNSILLKLWKFSYFKVDFTYFFLQEVASVINGLSNQKLSDFDNILLYL